VLNTHTLTATLIERFGTDEQRKTQLPCMATGEMRAAFSMSEPDASSDNKAMR
jgi:alkylation response protein AidB-like acyl-CoA dehydrogenase